MDLSCLARRSRFRLFSRRGGRIGYVLLWIHGDEGEDGLKRKGMFVVVYRRVVSSIGGGKSSVLSCEWTADCYDEVGLSR